uniref:DNA 5'-3' helicase n=1 Tax=viral metagenome TaxID=1070528 RepID=A0A6H1ZDI0_9ZZZZ
MNNIKEFNRIAIDGLKTPLIYDRDLELEVLACIVFNANNFSKIMLLDIDDFYSLEMKELFTAINGQYDVDRIINLPSIYTTLKSKDCYLSLYNRNNYVITSQVDVNIKGLKEKSNARKLQDISYQATIKVSEGENSTDIKNWLIGETEKIDTLNNIREITNDELDDRFEKMLSQSNLSPTTANLKKFDDKTGGFDKGTLTVIAAIQGAGKTTLAINLLNHICGSLNKSVLYVSLEMTFDTLDLMSITNLTGISYFKIKHRHKEIEEQDWKRINNARAKISEYKLTRIGEEEISTDIIRDKLREKNIDVVIIDYLQKVNYLKKYNNEYERLTNISRELKTLANEFNIPIIVIASLNREYSKRPDKTPQISDIRGSGSIEYDADMVLLLHREGAFGQYSGEKNVEKEFKFKHNAQLILAKNRFGESNIVIDLFFDGEKCLIKEMDEYEPE